MKKRYQAHMRRVLWVLWIFCLMALSASRKALAAEKGYFENPEEIRHRFWDRIYDWNYESKYGFLREEAPIYTGPYGSGRQGTAQKYSGIIVVSASGSRFQVIYETEKGYGIGWLGKKKYRKSVRFYDGREKQLLADGDYTLESMDASRKKQIHLSFLGDQQYKIKTSDKDKALDLVKEKGRYKKELCWAGEEDSESQSWQLFREYDHFYLKNKLSGLYLSLGEEGAALARLPQKIENVFGDPGTEQGPEEAMWKIGKRADKNVTPYENFLQYDPDWGREDYGDVDDYGGKIASAGCGVVAVTNAVYALNGQFMDPMIVARLAVDKGYRIVGSGTDDGIFRAAAQEFGEAYGFSYLGRVYDTDKLRAYLEKGCTAISHVPGHYVAVADYSGDRGKYLVLDPHPIPSRPTDPFGNWLGPNRLKTGGLASSCYYIYGVNEKEETKR